MFLYAIRHYLFFLILSLCKLTSSRNIFSTTDVFYSCKYSNNLEFCSVGYITPGTWNLACTTSVPQQGILRHALALSSFGKYQSSLFRFAFTLNPYSDPTSSFPITLSYSNPVAGMKLGFFIVVIKTQTTQLFIDLITFSWTYGSNVDNPNNTPRTQTATKNVATSTIFTSGTAGLIDIPFTSYFRLWAPTPTFSSDGTKNLQYQITTTFANPNIIITLSIKPDGQMEEFGGFILLFNPAEIPISVAMGFNIDYQNLNFSMGQNYDLSAKLPTYGPNFEGKCLVGFYHFKYKGDNFFYYTFSPSPFGNISAYVETNNSAAKSWGNFFCFGNSTMCSQDSTYTDLMDLGCYTGPTCPLPVFTGWNDTIYCPSCIQLICDVCTVTNRSDCLHCKNSSFSTLINGTCVCDTNFYEVTYPISTASQGQWNNLTPSLIQCKLNCTSAIPGCKLTNCTNTTYCVECLTNLHFLDLINTTNQVCTLCSVAIQYCHNCTDRNYCTDCDDGSYLLDVYTGTNVTGRSCPLCMMIMLFCTNCTDGQTCLNCLPGYFVNTTTKKCQCDPTFYNLTNCLECLFTPFCTVCDVNYFLNTSTAKCQPCKDLHPNCTSCSGEDVCDSCNVGFTLDPYIQADRTLCNPCGNVINNCTLCNSTTICTDCDNFYGVTLINSCKLCQSLVMPGCQLCQNSSLCLKCDNQTFMINNICHYCWQIYKCKDCFINSINQLECSLCVPGYILGVSVVDGQKLCLPCNNIVDYCQQCSNLTQCTLCVYPHLLSSAGLCDSCTVGYRYFNGACMKFPGCQITALNNNGVQTCIACINELHFVYNSETLTCLCDIGYLSFYQFDGWITCSPICGDGLIQTQYEECDDANNQISDGCNQMCDVETDFKCFNQPSHCVLYLDIQTVEYQYVRRVVGQNTGILSFKIEPKHAGLTKINWSKIVKFNFSSTSVNQANLQFTYIYQTGVLQIKVPYQQELESKDIKTSFTFDPWLIISKTTSVLLSNKLNGVNLPLIFEKSQILLSHLVLDILWLILALLFIIQFYIGSFFHKMIGLQTIQVAQTIYFVRLIVGNQFTTIFHTSINSAKFTAMGYSKYEIFGDFYQIKDQSSMSLVRLFLSIDMQKYFLLNVHFFLVPLLGACIVYGITLCNKFHKRTVYIQSAQPEQKQKFIVFRRMAQRLYDHFIFPFFMMFNLIGFFSIIMYETLKTSSITIKTFGVQNISISIHFIIVFGCNIIMIYQFYLSFVQEKMSKLTHRQIIKLPRSWRQKMQYDREYPDKPNYKPYYIPFYFSYYFLLQVALVIGIMNRNTSIGLQLVLVFSCIYFIFISYYKPYFKQVKFHNKYLKINHFIVLTFIIFCEIFDKSSKLTEASYISLCTLSLLLLAIVLIGGFIRTYYQVKTIRYANKQNNDEQQKMKINIDEDNQTLLHLQAPGITKNSHLLTNNKYAFPNQLKQLSVQYNVNRGSDGFYGNNNNNLTEKQQEIIIRKIRQDYKKKKQLIIFQQENQILEDYLSNNINPARIQQNDIKNKQKDTRKIKQLFDQKIKQKEVDQKIKQKEEDKYKLQMQNSFVNQSSNRKIKQQSSLQKELNVGEENPSQKPQLSGQKSLKIDNQRQALNVLKKKLRREWKMMYK